MKRKRLNYTKKDKEAFLFSLKEADGNIALACNNTKIPRKTIYYWKKTDEKIKEAIEDIQQISIDNVENALYKNCISGNVVAQIFFLKCRAKDRGYIDKVIIDGQIDHNVKQLVINVIDNETKLLIDEMKTKLIDKDGKDLIENN